MTLADDHDAAVARFLALVGRIPADAWHRPRAGGGWTLAAELEHVVLTHETAYAALRGETTLTPVVPAGKARLLRWLVLPIILRSTWFPRAKAPRETRPVVQADALDVTQLIVRLEQAARQLGGVARDPSVLRRIGAIVHPYFGPLRADRAVALVAAHLRHHTRQMARRADTTSP